MVNPLVLTFAEIAFALQPFPDRAAIVRERLGIKPEAASDLVAAAGAASLLARGLCTLSEGGVTPTDPIIVLAAGLSHADSYTEAVSWTRDRPVVLHIFSSALLRLAFLPAAFGQFTFEQLDATVPLAEPVMRLFDSCAPGPQAAVAVRSGVGAAQVSIAVARDGVGAWYVSDSEHSPGRGEPSTREAAVARLTELLGPRPLGPRPLGPRPLGARG